MEKRTLGISPVRLLCEIAIMGAFGFVLDELAGILCKGLFPNGGSISIALVAVALMAYRRGFLPALAVGFVMGLLDLMTGPYMAARELWQVVFQVLLDYVIAYPLVAAAGLFKGPFDKADSRKGKIIWIVVGVVVGSLLKLASHFTAGVLFWNDPSTFAWQGFDVVPYCFLYNLAYVGPSMVLSAIVLSLIYLRAPFLMDQPKAILNGAESKQNTKDLIASGAVLAVGFASSLYYGIKYGQSYGYEKYDWGESEIYFDPDYMGLFVGGLLLLGLGVICLIDALKKKEVVRTLVIGVNGVFGATFIYGLSRLVRAFVKSKDPTLYWIWVGVATLLLAGAIVSWVFVEKARDKKELEVEETPAE